MSDIFFDGVVCINCGGTKRYQVILRLQYNAEEMVKNQLSLQRW